MGQVDTLPARELQYIRRENLRTFIRQNGGPTRVATLLGHANGSYLAQLAGPNPTRCITEKVARKFETKLGLPFGYFDYDPALVIAEPGWKQNEMVRSASRYVTEFVRQEGAHRFSAEKVAEVVTAAVHDSFRRGRVDPARIEFIVKHAT